jgi:outer membrane protein TolC
MLRLSSAAALVPPALVLGAGLTLLAGCGSFSTDAGMGAVNSIVAPELRQGAVKVDSEAAAAEARGRTARLLKSTLSVNAAVEIALLDNKGLQAAYNELGLAEAVMVQASLPPAPTISLSRISTPLELDIERRIVADILALATLGIRSEIAADRFRQAQLRAALETLRLGAETRRSYYRAIAARQLIGLLTQSVAAAETAAKLAKELAETGAMNKLDQAREDAFHADLVTELAVARERAQSEREHLIRALGLMGGDLSFKLPDALPSPPRRPRELAAVEIEALRRRVDLEIARIELDALAKAHGLTNATRFINLLDVAGVSRTQRDAAGTGGTGGGAEVAFQIPVFDLGEARVRAATETYMQAVNRLTEKAVNVRSEAREAYRAYRSRYDIAMHLRNDVLPLRKIISDETMLRYGAMQIDVFALLAEARARIAANMAAIEAQREFWLASTNLDVAIVGGGLTNNEAATERTPLGQPGGGAEQ